MQRNAQTDMDKHIVKLFFFQPRILRELCMKIESDGQQQKVPFDRHQYRLHIAKLSNLGTFSLWQLMCIILTTCKLCASLSEFSVAIFNAPDIFVLIL